MFISSLILSTAYGAECPDGDENCADREAPPLVILEPTKSPGAIESEKAEALEDTEDPPLVILAPVPRPDVDDVPTTDEEEEEDVVVVTDRDVRKDSEQRAELVAQYALQFLGDGPAHQLQLRRYGKKDAYLGAELRYLPGNDAILWSGRLGAGIDLMGASPFDVQLGLFMGSAGEWLVYETRPAIYHSPILGTEVRLGFEGRRFFTSYRWLGGIGVRVEPLQQFLTEREFILGYKLNNTVQIFGESVRINPRSGDSQWALGLGGRLTF
ncbi:MAG: hypothetical protein AAGA48_17780 [Myxococcota bacterium]